MDFSDNDPTPVTEPLHGVIGFDPDDDPTPVQEPLLRPHAFPDPFDADTVVAEPVLDFEISPARAERSMTPARPVPDVLRPPPSITDSDSVATVDPPPEDTATTAPIGLDADKLFDDIEDSPLPPPMMMDPPAPRQLPLPWRGSGALRSNARPRRLSSWIAMSLCALAGAAVASAGFIIAGMLSEPPPRPAAVQPRATEPIKVTTANAAPPPDLELPGTVDSTEAAKIDVSVERPVAEAVKTPTDRPAVIAGEQMARAIRPCLRRRLNRSVRVAAYMLPAGTVRRAFVAKRSWLTPSHRRCIKRRLTGLELLGVSWTGYADWRLTMRANGEEAVLLNRRRR